MRSLILALAVLTLASTVDAAACRDPKTGHFLKCPPPAPAAATAAPRCVKGKVCGHSCIAIDKICHKPG
jgi:hypothetical protein